MMKDRVMLSVGQEVKEAAMKMGKDLGVSVARMGEEILTTYAKIEFERISQLIRILEAAEVSTGAERDVAAMMDRIRKEREPFRKLAEIYDREDHRRGAAIDAAIDEHLVSEKGRKKAGK